MGRRQIFAKSELLEQAKQVLLEHGYDGFQLKLLSQRLVGARSTIYQYFANKDEIIAACMRHVMEDVLQQASQVDETDCMNALRQLLTIYLKESGFHQLVSYADRVNTKNSAAAAADLAFVEQAHSTLQEQLERLFLRARDEGLLNEAIPLPAAMGVFFNLIDTPNMMNVPVREWSDILFRIWLDGAGKRQAPFSELWTNGDDRPGTTLK
jgi:AcrR family transcriptional regulator